MNTVDEEGTVTDRQGGVKNAGASEVDKLRATEHRNPHLSEYFRARILLLRLSSVGPLEVHDVEPAEPSSGRVTCFVGIY